MKLEELQPKQETDILPEDVFGEFYLTAVIDAYETLCELYGACPMAVDTFYANLVDRD